MLHTLYQNHFPNHPSWEIQRGLKDLQLSLVLNKDLIYNNTIPQTGPTKVEPNSNGSYSKLKDLNLLRVHI